MSRGAQAKPGTRRRRSAEPIALARPARVRLRVSDEDFWRLCLENDELRLERTEKGVVEIMAPTSGGTGAECRI